MYKILCRFRDESRFEDTFCDVDEFNSAKHFAKRWKQGLYCHDEDAVAEVIVVDKSGKTVYRE